MAHEGRPCPVRRLSCYLERAMTSRATPPTFVLATVFATACGIAEAPARTATPPAARAPMAEPIEEPVAEPAPRAVDPRIATARAHVRARHFAEAAATFRGVLDDPASAPSLRAEAHLGLVQAWLAREATAAVAPICARAEGAPPRGSETEAERAARLEAHDALRARREARELLDCVPTSDGAHTDARASLVARIDALDAEDRAACEARSARAEIDVSAPVRGPSRCQPSRPAFGVASAIDRRMGVPAEASPVLAVP